MPQGPSVAGRARRAATGGGDASCALAEKSKSDISVLQRESARCEGEAMWSTAEKSESDRNAMQRCESAEDENNWSGTRWSMAGRSVIDCSPMEWDEPAKVEDKRWHRAEKFEFDWGLGRCDKSGDGEYKWTGAWWRRVEKSEFDWGAGQ